jgi:ABC-2 type transport system permease protein
VAVYKQTYKAYQGPLTPEWSRWTIIPRYSIKGAFRSKFMTAFLVVSFFYPLWCICAIYLRYNISLLEKVNIFGAQRLEIGGTFYWWFVNIQSFFAFLLATFLGPPLISKDLANNGLPLYLCRPFSRLEYVFGKFSVIAGVLSIVTWVPGIILFLVQSALAGSGWFRANLWIAWSVFAGSLVWIVVLSLLALALSAWVRWRIAAGALMLGVFFLGAGFAQAINAVVGTDHGYYFDIGAMAGRVWSGLFGTDPRIAMGQFDAWMGLIAVCVACLLLLERKVRAFEVVK